MHGIRSNSRFDARTRLPFHDSHDDSATLTSTGWQSRSITLEVSNYARSGEKSTLGSRDALPHSGPARRQPLLSGTDPGILTGSAKSIVLAHCRQQFFPAGCDVFYRDLCARLFWDFAASGPGRRRSDRHCDRMEGAEGEGASKTE